MKNYGQLDGCAAVVWCRKDRSSRSRTFSHSVNRVVFECGCSWPFFVRSVLKGLLFVLHQADNILLESTPLSVRYIIFVVYLNNFLSFPTMLNKNITWLF